MMLPAAVTMIPNYLVWNWLRQFFLGLPRERFEAARVDGTSYLQLFRRITLPRGLKVILDQFGQGGEAQWEVVLAASVIATLPMLVIFFIGQRYFVAGIATTGRKG
jgi:multiple sugar transport system permease protein